MAKQNKTRPLREMVSSLAQSIESFLEMNSIIFADDAVRRATQ